RDLELGVVGARRSHRALDFEPFLRDRVVLAVPAGHRFAGRAVSLAERVGDLNVAMEAGLQESAKSAVEAGYGVCFFSSLAVQKELRLGSLATAEVAGLDPVRDFYSVRLATRSRRRLTDAFLQWC